jgi:predicted flap endonuclease-1-like 5' DNA nuclease
MARIIDIEGIGPKYSEKLIEMDIETTEDLLEKCSTKKGRMDAAESTGISESLILEWVNMADLFRIRGVAEEFSDLLEGSGVDTVVELAMRNPENLYAKMVEVNEMENLVNRLPSQRQVSDWVEQAKNLPRKVEY